MILLPKIPLAFFRSSLRRTKDWFTVTAIPNIHSVANTFVDRLTYEDGSSEWASLAPSNRWNRYIIWTLVGVSTFGITWSLFARIDETVSATGKLEPLGTTIDVKAPLGVLSKIYWLLMDNLFARIRYLLSSTLPPHLLV